MKSSLSKKKKKERMGATTRRKNKIMDCVGSVSSINGENLQKQ